MSDAFSQDHPDPDGADAREIAQAEASGASDLSDYSGDVGLAAGDNTIAMTEGGITLDVADTDSEGLSITASAPGTSLMLQSSGDGGSATLTANGADGVVNISASGTIGITATGVELDNAILLEAVGNGSAIHIIASDGGFRVDAAAVQLIGTAEIEIQTDETADAVIHIFSDGENGSVNISAIGTGGTVDINADDGASVSAGTGLVALSGGNASIAATANGGVVNIQAVGVGSSVLVTSTDLLFTIENAPEVPATPLPQDIVDALVTLGLITQAAP